MMKSFCLLVAVCLLLAGCVLQSNEALYDDKSSALLLKPYGSVFSTYNLVDGTWEKQSDIFSLKTSGRHYVTQDKEVDVELHFVALVDSWSVLQAQEKGKPATYVLANLKGDAVELHFLACSDLKKHGSISNKLVFDGDDCQVGSGFGLAEFKILAKHTKPATVKLVAEDK